jgi:hypothetical protein
MNLAAWPLLGYGRRGTGAYPGSRRTGPPASRGGPPGSRYRGRGVAVDTIQTTLGQALLVLIGLAVVLFALILLLVEANYIVRLSRTLIRRLKSSGPDPTDSDSSAAASGYTQRPHDEQEAR